MFPGAGDRPLDVVLEGFGGALGSTETFIDHLAGPSDTLVDDTAALVHEDASSAGGAGSIGHAPLAQFVRMVFKVVKHAVKQLYTYSGLFVQGASGSKCTLVPGLEGFYHDVQSSTAGSNHLSGSLGALCPDCLEG